MLKGFWKLTWVETKVFLREPMGVFGSLGIPVVAFLLLGGMFTRGPTTTRQPPPFSLPILAAILIAVGAVLSLVTIISIYREGGILKRLRATPLSPVTILAAHMSVKLIFTAVGLGLLVVAGRRMLPGLMSFHIPTFSAALTLSTVSILCMGFVIASLVPTARFAQPIGVAFLYPMVGISGLFFPVAVMPAPLRAVAWSLPTTHAVALLQGVLDAAPWPDLLLHVVALTAIAGVCLWISSRVFRWE